MYESILTSIKHAPPRITIETINTLQQLRLKKLNGYLRKYRPNIYN